MTDENDIYNFVFENLYEEIGEFNDTVVIDKVESKKVLTTAFAAIVKCIAEVE
ncbi:MAG: hypothetical protein M3R72_06850 [Bacteroidota bacterium]|nr:hypothetical protein [Bacteroidota bacterium]